MADFSKTIKSKYDFKTYESTKKAVDWILLSLKKIELSSQKPKVSFLFNIGDIGCSCETIEEFVENAYGQKGYSLTEVKVVQFLHSNICAYICSRNNNELYISTNNKNTLEKIIQSLEVTCVDDSDNDKKQKDSKVKQWFIAIMQNLLANWIWYLLTLIASALILYFS